MDIYRSAVGMNITVREDFSTFSRPQKQNAKKNAIVTGAIGFLVVSLIVTQIMGINTCELSTIVTAIYEAILGVVVSTLFAYFALKSYEKKVKYTRRDK